jgi:hypothetical protein
LSTFIFMQLTHTSIFRRFHASKFCTFIKLHGVPKKTLG